MCLACIISFNTIHFKLRLAVPVFKMRKLRLKKRWITCPESRIQASGRSGLKSRTVYYKARFSDQSVRRGWVCLNCMVLLQLSTSSRNLSTLWLNPSSHVALDFGWQPFYCWTRSIAWKLSFDVQWKSILHCHSAISRWVVVLSCGAT